MSFWDSLKHMFNSIIDTDPELKSFVKRRSGRDMDDHTDDFIGSFRKDKPKQTPINLSKRERDSMNDIFFGDDD